MKRRLIFMGSAALGAALGLIPAIGEGVGSTIVFAIIGSVIVTAIAGAVEGMVVAKGKPFRPITANAHLLENAEEELSGETSDPNLDEPLKLPGHGDPVGHRVFFGRIWLG